MIKFLRKRRAVAMSEYGILGALIAVAAITSLTLFGKSVMNSYCSVQVKIVSALGLNSDISQCYDSLWMSYYHLSDNSTPDEISQACSGVATCFAHYYQMKYNANSTNYLTSIGLGSYTDRPYNGTDANAIANNFLNQNPDLYSSDLIRSEQLNAMVSALTSSPSGWAASRDPNNYGVY